MSTTLVELYKARGGHRWRMRDKRNGKIIGCSSEGYKRKVDMLKNLYRVSNAGLDVTRRYKV